MVLLEVTNVSKKYSNNFQALSDITFSLQENNFLALLGRNGAGKTTLVGILSSLIKKTSGKIKIFGMDLDDDYQKIKLKIGVVPQEYNLSIFETPIQILINQAGYFGISKNIALERAEKYLDLMDLYHKRNVQVVTLSGGMKRRLMIARALMNEPELIFLDEPTAGVDIEVRHKIWDFMLDLKKAGKTIILTTHYLEDVDKLCDSLVLIDNGKLVLQDEIKNLQYPNKVVSIKYDGEILQQEIAKEFNNINFTDENSFNLILESEIYLNEILKTLDKLGVKISAINMEKNQIESLLYQKRG